MPTFNRANEEQFEKARDLLEAGPQGELGFMKSLFFGRLRMDQIMPFPRQQAGESFRTDELILKTEEFLHANVDPDRIDAEERIDRSVIDGLGRMGLLGMTVGREYGGGGFSHTSYCRVLERVSQWCASTAVLVGAHQSIGLKALVLMGTEEQKKQFLPDLASGKMLAAFCLSEPQVGSDAANVQTTAVPDGKGGWIINGDKKYATNAALAGMLTVMARTPIEENGQIKQKITAFLVTPDLPGFEIVAANRSKCGIRGSWQGTLRFNDMRVPGDRILGELGRGLKVALSVLDYGRCTLCAGCVGGAKKALEMAVTHARTRQQFGRPIGRFGLIQQKIARMAETTFAMESLTYLAAGLVDQHRGDIMLETAAAKLFCSEGLWQVMDDAVQIWGGEGYMRENGLERGLRDARINRIVEGASEVMTAFIALVGMKGVGEEFQRVLRAAKHPVGNFGRLAQFAHDQWSDVIVGPSPARLHPSLQSEGSELAHLTRQLARTVGRLLRRYRENILEMQLIQQRVAGAAVELFAMAAVIARLQAMLESNDNGNVSAHRDLLIGKAFCQHAAERIKQNLRRPPSGHDAKILEVANAVLGW